MAKGADMTFWQMVDFQLEALTTIKEPPIDAIWYIRFVLVPIDRGKALENSHDEKCVRTITPCVRAQMREALQKNFGHRLYRWGVISLFVTLYNLELNFAKHNSNFNYNLSWY